MQFNVFFTIAQAPPYPLGQAPACMKTNSLPINTGWNWKWNTEFWTLDGEKDSYWRITNADGTPTPVCATPVVWWQPAGGWGPFNQSRVISTLPNAANVNNNASQIGCNNVTTPFTFERRIWVDTNVNVPGTIQAMNVKVDDHVWRVYFNGNLLPVGVYSTTCWMNNTGGVTFPAWPVTLAPGMNRLEFVVYNRSTSGAGGTSTMGFNLETSITSPFNVIMRNEYYVPNLDLGCGVATSYIDTPKIIGKCIPLPATTGYATITNYNPAFTYILYPDNIGVNDSFTISAGNTYTIVVSDANNCFISTVFSAFNNNIAPVLTLNPPHQCLPYPMIGFAGVHGKITNDTLKPFTSYVFDINAVAPGCYGHSMFNIDSFFGAFNYGIYKVVVEDSIGCIAIDTAYIGFTFSTTLKQDPDTLPPCLGNNVVLKASVPSWVIMGTYSLNGGTPQASPYFTVNTAGTYTVTATDAFGCTATATCKVNTYPTITSIVSNNIPCAEELTAMSDSILTYTWWADTSIGITTNPLVTDYVLPPGTTTYTVIGVDDVGCTATATYVHIQNPFCCGKYDTLPTTVFSSLPIYNNGTATAILNAYGNPPGNIISTNDELYMDGTIIIDQDISFVNCPNIKLTYQTQLILNPNVNLYIENSTLQNLCNMLWSGISTGVTPVNNSLHIENSILRDMKDGVIATNNTNLHLIDNRFYDNYMSVQIGNTTPPYNMQTGNCVITGNTFKQVSNFLKYPHSMQEHGERGIVLVNCQEVEIGELNATTFSNTFDNIYNGIYILSTMPNQTQDYHIFNNYFHNIYWGENDWWGHAHWKVNNWAQAGSQAHRGVAIYGLKYPNTPVPNHTVYIKYTGIDDPNPSFNRCDKAVMLHGMSAQIEKARVGSTLMGFMMNRADGQEFSIHDNDLENIISQPGYVDHLYKGIKIVGNNGKSEIIFNRIMTAPIDLPMGTNHIGPAAIEIEHPNAANTQQLSIYNNIIDHYAPTGNGIYMRNVQQQNIVRLNNIQLHNTQGPGSYIGLRAAGIQLDNCKFTQVLGNIVNGNMTLLASANHFDAMRMQSSIDCILECNIFSYTPRGLRVIGNNTSPSPMIRGNSCLNHGRGWYFQNLGAVEAGFGNVGSPAEDNWNMFWSSAIFGGGYGIWRDGNLGFVGQIFTTLFGLSFSGANNNFARYGVVPNPGATPYACDYTVYTPPVWWFANMGISEEQAEQIINDSLQNNNMEENIQWAMEQELHYALERDELLRNSSATLQNYYTSQSSSNMGILARVNTQLARIYDSSVVNNYSKFVTQLQLIDSMNASLNSPNEAESNTQTINRYYLKWLTGGIDSLQSDEIDTLAYIAALCPTIWGNAVIRARSMYDNVAQVHYNDLYSCAGWQNKNSNQEEEKIDLNILRAIAENKINLYPNPVNEILTIDYAIQMDSKTILQIIDMTGKVVIETTLSPLHNRTTIPMKNLSKGVYMYKVAHKEHTIQTGKLIKE